MNPLYTAPAIEFLETIIRPEWKVFEYGGGGSTNYFSNRCQEVHVVEHNDGWVNSIRNESPLATVYHVGSDQPVEEVSAVIDTEFYSRSFSLPTVESREHSYNQYHGLTNDEYRGYASVLGKFEPGYFDCIAVDGMARSLCLWYASKLIKQGGYIILDNSDRWLFNDLQHHLISIGLNRKDFWQSGHPCWCTSFFSSNFSNSDEPFERPVGTGDIYHFG